MNSGRIVSLLHVVLVMPSGDFFTDGLAPDLS